MPRRAKLIEMGEVSTAPPGPRTIQDMQRQLEENLQQEKAVRLQGKQLREDIAEARRGQQARRASVLGNLLLDDHSDAGRALLAACLARIEVPEHRELFGLAPRPEGLLGVATVEHLQAPADQASSDVPIQVTLGDETLNGTGRGDLVGEISLVQADQEDDPDNADRHDDALQSPQSGDAVSGDNASAESGPPRSGDLDGNQASGATRAASVTTCVDEQETPDDGADHLHSGRNAVRQSSPESTRLDGIPDGLLADELAALSPPPLDPFGTQVASADQVGTTVVDPLEDDSAAGLRSLPHVADDAPTNPVSDVNSEPHPTSPSFTPRVFFSTLEAKDRIKAHGLKLQKQGGGTWTVTATTVADMEFLTRLELRPYGQDSA